MAAAWPEIINLPANGREGADRGVIGRVGSLTPCLDCHPMPVVGLVRLLASSKPNNQNWPFSEKAKEPLSNDYSFLSDV